MAANPSTGNPAITEIENIAKSVYGVNGDKSIPLTANSNAVLVQSSSLQKFALVLTQPPVQTVPAGTTVNWVNVLTNSSYSDETVELTYRYPETLSNFKALSNTSIT